MSPKARHRSKLAFGGSTLLMYKIGRSSFRECVFQYVQISVFVFFLLKKKKENEMRISDWRSDECSSDLSRASWCGIERPWTRNSRCLAAACSTFGTCGSCDRPPEPITNTRRLRLSIH